MGFDPKAAAARRAERRAARRDRFLARYRAGPLALAGVAASVALLYLPGLAPRAAVLAASMALAAWAGRKVSPLGTLLVSAGIVAANLLVPVGAVLFRVGPFPVTATALLEGAERAATFEALIHLSKAFLRPDLRLPGRFGRLVGEALSYYERILALRPRLRPATFLRDLDDLLVSIYA